MPDQEFLASYAVDIDEQGVERLQSILEENRSLAVSLSKAFSQAYADLDSFVREAIVSIPSLARFEEAQASAIDSAGKAEQAILALTSAYSGLTAAIPDESLDLSITGISGERNESGRKNSEFASWLSDISGSLNRLVMLSAGTDNVSDASGGAGRGAAGAGVSGESALSLNLAGYPCHAPIVARQDGDLPRAVYLEQRQERSRRYLFGGAGACQGQANFD